MLLLAYPTALVTIAVGVMWIIWTMLREVDPSRVFATIPRTLRQFSALKSGVSVWLSIIVGIDNLSTDVDVDGLGVDDDFPWEVALLGGVHRKIKFGLSTDVDDDGLGYDDSF